MEAVNPSDSVRLRNKKAGPRKDSRNNAAYFCFCFVRVSGVYTRAPVGESVGQNGGVLWADGYLSSVCAWMYIRDVFFSTWESKTKQKIVFLAM